MSQPYKLSVVIPCYNHGEFVGEAVESVIGAKREDLELIVIDDGSTDDRTRKEMEELCARGIRVIRQENKGLSAARNAGIRASHGDYIFPLDADDRMHSAWIDRGIEILDSNPKVGVVYGDVEVFGTTTARWRMGPFEPERLLEKNYIPCSALYRRSVWEQNGGYDETMLQGYEDWEFWIAAFGQGWAFACLPEVFFSYRQTADSMLTRVAALRGQTEDYVARKHGPLYRRAWLRCLTEDLSLTRTSRRLGRLLLWKWQALSK